MKHTGELLDHWAHEAPDVPALFEPTGRWHSFRSLRGRVRLDAAVESYKQSWRTVARLMDAGLDFDEAVKVTAQRLHTSERTIRHHWDERARRTKSVSLWERDREIMRLAAAGYTNKQIAERLAQLGWCSPSRPGKPMAPGSISRIITKRLGR